MKSAKAFRTLIIIAFIIVASIAAAILVIAEISKADAPRKAANAVLTKVYGATQRDYDNLTNAMGQGMEEYLHTVYGEQLTENGYKAFIENRIPGTAAMIAHQENSDLRISSVELKPEDAVEGSQRYSFTIRAQTENDASKTFTFQGNISLVQESGRWKVNGASPA